jgi:L-lactate dehydrogenase complex protein LldF
LHIASIGIEKLLPKIEHLGVFVRMLSRSALGSPITQITSHFRAPRPGTEIHVVLVDNGRSERLGMEDFWYSLKCIRCGACMNTCPIYRRSGGHSYGSTVPGPIGSVLTPGLDLDRYASLPFASTLCGSCTAVCPVKIDLDAQLFRWRQHVVESGKVSLVKKAAIGSSTVVLDRPRLFRIAGALVRFGLRLLPEPLARRAAGAWGRTREAPVAPQESFRAWYRKHRGGTT